MVSVVWLSAGLCWWMVCRSLVQLSIWHRRLAELANVPNPSTVALATGDSSAEHGWNRLIQQGQHWTALSAMRQSINERLYSSSTRTTDQLLDAISHGIAAVDADGKITYVNSVMAGICGRSSTNELVGQPIQSALHLDQETSKFVCSTDTHQCAAEWTVPTDRRMLRGERKPLVKEQGVAGYVWTIRDVTQQRLAESMREKFLSAATHEFRTPLANIRAYAESLDMSSDIDAESRKRFYNIIQSESSRLSQLVDDLLDVSRMQAGALSLEATAIDLSRLVEEVSEKVAGQMKEKSIEYLCEFPRKYPEFNADKNKLIAAIVNLLGNAAKYTPEKGKVLFRVDVSERQVQFTVTDSGYGIAPEELSKVFDRFFRSSDDRVREISGSGLGLTLVQEVARLHGGEVTVESELNKGSTFRLSIPLSSVE